MFQSRARNATAAASPVRISGVARVRVSVSANCEPAAPFADQRRTPKSGEAPAASTSSAAKPSAAAIAASG